MHTSFGKAFDIERLPLIWIDLNSEDCRFAGVASNNIEQLYEALGAGSNKHKREAIRWLYSAQTTGTAPECIEIMRKELAAGNFFLTDIGTSEDNLKEIVRDYHKREANRWLQSARTTGVAPACIEYVHNHLKQGNWTLVDIGTSEDDLKMLVRKYEAMQRQHA